MKIQSIHTDHSGPLGSQVFDFRDAWSGETATRILFSGPNGCGKSSVLRGVATLWLTLGQWLHTRKPLPQSNAELEWLKRGDGIAVVLGELPFGAPPMALVFGEKKFVENLQGALPDCAFLGEWFDRTGKRGKPARRLLWPTNADWLDEWTRERQKMLVSSDAGKSPNMIFLDAEERRWVKPKRRIGDIRPENLSQRWLSRYLVSEDWDGQLESGLLSLKTASQTRFEKMVDHMNQFLSSKEILKDVKWGENRLWVKLKGKNPITHYLDELSAGEHQVLILLYQIDRWMEEGGIALIDEPDLYLHPSLISGLMARLETMVGERHGQLIITSHVPEVWQRYEALGQRVLLEVSR